MPNWCHNSLTVSGPESIVDLFIERARGTPPEFKRHSVDIPSEDGPIQEELLCFHKFVPVPQGLLERTFGNEGGPATPVDGYLSGYDWQAEKWGCKWGACDTEFERVNKREATYSFDTAWAPPVALMEAIAEMPEFASLTLYNEYEEPGMHFKGTTLVKDGECVDACEEMEDEDFDDDDDDDGYDDDDDEG